MAVKSVGDGVTVAHPSTLRVTEGTTRRARGGGRRARGAAPPLSELDAVIAALGEADVEVVKRLDITPAPLPRARRGESRRARAPIGTQDVEVSVQLAPNEDAVILVVQDDEYHWELPDGTTIGARRQARARASEGGRRRPRTVTFRVAVRPPAEPPPARRARGAGAPSRRARGIFGKAIALVLKFARRVVGELVIKQLEKKVKPGLVRVSSNDPESWDTLKDTDQLPMPADRPARVLLLVHGTFSSTVGSFSGLRHTPEGLAFLDAAMAHYDLILGYDHRSLSDVPADNAKQIVDRLARIRWNQPPEIDSIGYSRGGLVLRTMLERTAAGSALQANFGRAVFIACTNGGTLLAEPENWGKLVDVYTNLAAAATRGLVFVPQARAVATILTVTIKGIGLLVKYLASFIIDGGGVPGLSAMEPDGDVVTSLNARARPETLASEYLAVTNDYEPSKAEQDGSAALLPPSLRQKLSDGLVDRLMGEANDLVVNTKAMATVGSGEFPGRVFALGANGRTIHTTYFRDARVVAQLGAWLLDGAQPRERGMARRRATTRKGRAKRSAAKGSAKRAPRKTAKRAAKGSSKRAAASRR